MELSKYRRPALIGAVAVVAAGVLWRLFAGHGGMPDGLILANGRIEGDRVSVASKIPGRIAELKVREGDVVAAGDLMARLDDAQIQAKVDQAAAAVGALEAQHEAAATSLAALRKRVPLDIAAADAGLQQARASADKARSADDQSARDAQRMAALAARGSVPQQRAELATLALAASSADRTAAGAAVARARDALAGAQLGADAIHAQEHQLAALSAQLEQARAALRETQSVLADLNIRAPQAGIVVTRIRDTGEVVGAGGPLFELVDLDRLYLKIYVPETQIGKLHLGLPARIYTDAFPGQPYAATLRYIASRAEFTPKEVQTVDERVNLTFAAQLYLDANPGHRLSPGLPADAVIRWRDDVAWSAPQWP